MSVQSRVTSPCDVAHCGREELHHFLSVILQGMLPLFSIMTLWGKSLNYISNKKGKIQIGSRGIHYTSHTLKYGKILFIKGKRICR